MADTKHTPGDWKLGMEISAEELGNEILTIIEAEGYGIIGYAVATPADDEELKANADLMAAASTLQSRIDRLEAEKADLVEVLMETLEEYIGEIELSPGEERLLEKKGLGLKHDPTVIKARSALSKHTPVSEQGGEQTNPKPESE